MIDLEDLESIVLDLQAEVNMLKNLISELQNELQLVQDSIEHLNRGGV